MTDTICGNKKVLRSEYCTTCIISKVYLKNLLFNIFITDACMQYFNGAFYFINSLFKSKPVTSCQVNVK